MISIASYVPCPLMHVDMIPEGAEARLVRDGSRQQCLRLNTAAVEIWNRCDGTRTTLAISRELEDDLDLPDGALYQDVADSIQRFVANHLVVLKTPRGAGAPELDVDWRRMAEPRPDAYDTVMTARLLRSKIERLEIGEYTLDTPAPARSIMEGRIDVSFPYDLDRQGYTHLSNAPAEHPNIDRAVELLSRWKPCYEQFKALMSAFQPVCLDDQPFNVDASWSQNHSAEWMHGTMWSTINCPLALAENMAHELAHQKAFALGIYKEFALGLITNDPAEGYKSPFRDYLRPMPAVFHAAYAVAYMTNLNIVLAQSEPDGPLSDKNQRRLRQNAARLEHALAELNAKAIVDTEGESFLQGFNTWAARLISTAGNPTKADSVSP